MHQYGAKEESNRETLHYSKTASSYMKNILWKITQKSKNFLSADNKSFALILKRNKSQLMFSLGTLIRDSIYWALMQWSTLLFFSIFSFIPLFFHFDFFFPSPLFISPTCSGIFCLWNVGRTRCRTQPFPLMSCQRACACAFVLVCMRDAVTCSDVPDLDAFRFSIQVQCYTTQKSVATSIY